MESGLPTLQEAEHPQAKAEGGACAPSLWVWGQAGLALGLCLSGAQTLHTLSILFALMLFMSCGTAQTPGAVGLSFRQRPRSLLLVWCGVRHRLCSSCRSAELLLLLLLPGWCWAAVGAGAFCGNHCCPLPSSPDFCLPLTEETCAASILWGSKSTFCPSESRAVNLKGWYSHLRKNFLCGEVYPSLWTTGTELSRACQQGLLSPGHRNAGLCRFALRNSPAPLSCLINKLLPAANETCFFPVP